MPCGGGGFVNEAKGVTRGVLRTGMRSVLRTGGAWIPPKAEPWNGAVRATGWSTFYPHRTMIAAGLIEPAISSMRRRQPR